MVYLTRKIEFSASHLYHNPAFSAEENRRVFGKCNNPFGHGHNYILEVTVAGDPDVVSGLIVPVAWLDELVGGKILRLFRNPSLSLDMAEFAHLVPTTENVTQVAADLLARDWREYIGEGSARLEKV